MPAPKRQKKRASQSKPGRPDTGIRSGYVRFEVWLPLDVREGLQRLADRREQQTGKPTSRADVVRDALEAYVRVNGEKR